MMMRSTFALMSFSMVLSNRVLPAISTRAFGLSLVRG